MITWGQAMASPVMSKNLLDSIGQMIYALKHPNAPVSSEAVASMPYSYAHEWLDKVQEAEEESESLG